MQDENSQDLNTLSVESTQTADKFSHTMGKKHSQTY